MGTLTTNLGLDKPTVGADSDQWGTLLNQSMDTLDLSVQFGALTKSVAGGVNVTLSANEAAKQVIILTGTLTANIAVIVPNSPVRRYVIRNSTTGAFTVTVRRAVGTGVIVPQGGTRLVYNDGTDVFFEDVQFSQTAASATTATTATNVSGGTASVTTLTASGAAALNGGVTTTTLNATGNVTLGDAGTDTALLNAQLSAGGGVGALGQALISRGVDQSPQWGDVFRSLAPQMASGTSVTFTGIPTTAKRVTLSLNSVSSNGADLFQVQLGTAAGFTVTGYANVVSAGNAASSYTSGFVANINGQAAANSTSGSLVFTKSVGNTWVCSGVAGVDNAGAVVGSISFGSVSLAQAITQIRLTTLLGTDTFDAGSVVVFYE